MRRVDLAMLECPRTRSPLSIEADDGEDWLEQGTLLSTQGSFRYPVQHGIPRLLPEDVPSSSKRQQAHYARIASTYLDVRQEVPFTKAYCEYLDALVTERCGHRVGSSVLEACCGDGTFLSGHFERAAHRIGIDVTPQMLIAGSRRRSLTLVCGDATRMPVRAGAFDLVLLHGGVHHVTNRGALFSESFRALRAGGRFVCLEPVDDFVIHRWLRRVIYARSPLLDQESERPLRLEETRHQMEGAGFEGFSASPCGYLAAGLFANTDVMGFMRHLAKVPGHMTMTRALIACDELWRIVPVFRRMALMAIVTAEKR